jgi:PAS domain S-box-containing protein
MYMPADIRLSPRLMAGILEGLRDAVVVVDDATRTILLCNSAATAIFGYPLNQMIGSPITLLHVDAAAREGFRQAVERAAGQGGFLSIPSFRMKRADGQIFDAEITVTPIEDARRIGWIGVIRDVSDRKAAEEALCQSEARYRSLIRHASYGIGRTSVDGRFLVVNPALARMLGYASEEELLAVRVPHVYHDSWVRQRLLERLDRQGEVEVVTEFVRKDGSLLTARVRTRALRGADGRLAAIELFAEDVTGHEAAEHGRAGAEAEVPGPERPKAGRIERALGLGFDFRQALAAVGDQIDGTGHLGATYLKDLSDAVASLPPDAFATAERAAVLYAAAQLMLYLKVSAIGEASTLAPEFHGPEAARACVDALDLRVSRLVEALRK